MAKQRYACSRKPEKTGIGNMKLLKNIIAAFKRSRIYRTLSNKYILATAVFCVWVIFFDQNSLIELARVKISNAEQKRTIKELNENIRAVDSKLMELNSNLDSLEKFAREEYFFHKPEETVYIIEKK